MAVVVMVICRPLRGAAAVVPTPGTFRCPVRRRPPDVGAAPKPVICLSPPVTRAWPRARRRAAAIPVTRRCRQTLG
ncbi:hypothetical protein [Amycolatopsis saalfeldensis]|uniref:hypothetical protein n=1 Tax=Amycolatopsis saalfeldensis TaxID=394193 RepID=UPI000B85FBB9|nr:hypothetical protein [Amycolatopsis saalfeldensis]